MLVRLLAVGLYYWLGLLLLLGWARWCYPGNIQIIYWVISIFFIGYSSDTALPNPISHPPKSTRIRFPYLYKDPGTLIFDPKLSQNNTSGGQTEIFVPFSSLLLERSGIFAPLLHFWNLHYTGGVSAPLQPLSRSCIKRALYIITTTEKLVSVLKGL